MEESHDSSGNDESLNSYDSEVGDYRSDIENGDGGIIEESPKTHQYALEMSTKGYAAIAEHDYETAAECYSRVLEIRTAHYGDLDRRCFKAYYYYGFALLRNALVDLCPDESTTNGVSSNVENDESCSDDITSGFIDETEYDSEDTPDNDEEESELDLAWKVLDIARVILEKRSTQTMDNVHVLCALAEVSNYRDDLTTCLFHYRKATNILENLAKTNLMFTARTYFRMGLCLETDLMTKQTVSCYRKAISCCSSKLLLLKRELISLNSASIDTVHIASLIHAKKQELGRVYNYYRMLQSKILEVEEVEKNPGDLRGAVDALAGKLRQLEMNVCSSSTSTNDEVIHIRKVGGFVSRVTAGMYSDSNKSSP